MMAVDQMRQSLRLLKQSALIYATHTRFSHLAVLSVGNRYMQFNGANSRRDSHLSSCKEFLCFRSNGRLRLDYRSFSNETSAPKKMEVKTKQDFKANLKRLIDIGVIRIPEPRIISSLPDKVRVTGTDESFIGFDITDFTTKAGTFPTIITASSGQEIFSRYCIPNEVPSEKNLEKFSLIYDTENQQYIKNGEAVETVDQKQAFSELLEFFKRHKNPVLTTFRGIRCSILSLHLYTLENDLYNELLETVPCFIDVLNMAKYHLPLKMVGRFSLNSLCQFGLKHEVPNFDPVQRAISIRRLFEEFLLSKGFESFVSSLDFYHARATYVQMLLDDKIQPLTSNRLARQGVGLDHLQYLKTKGKTEFQNYLKERYISGPDIENLFEVV